LVYEFGSQYKITHARFKIPAVLAVMASFLAGFQASAPKFGDGGLKNQCKFTEKAG
jgi:hypothetical protein